VASPVYVRNNFNGVVAADMKLSEITKQVQALKIGQTGYAFMIDDAGRIISMPPAGYELFGLKPEELENQDFSKQTLLGQGESDLSVVVRRMVAGGNGLLTVNVSGVPTYIAFSPVPTNGYSLGMVVPVSELQSAIIAARNDVQVQVQAGLRVMVLLLVLLLIVAILVSLILGQVITSPIIRLTEVANQIVDGDLDARSLITAEDEIGTLSTAFNTMTSRLRDALKELERRVEQRTAELAGANERNERRAQQFESISQVAATISSTRDLNALLPQITAAIAEKFGFYHAGIFLLDSRREYAVLSAANSAGGQQMLANGHRLRVGETGIVGYVTGTGRARVALNTGQDAAFFNNPFLPDTRSEVALPLKAGDEIIGALDVQSTVENAFGQEDVNILTALADQVSIAIQNARQYEETRKALAESTATARQFVQTGWQQFTKSQKIAGIRHTGARASILYSDEEENHAETGETRNQFRNKNRGVSLSLPVKLRGEVIGTVDVHSVDNRKWDQDELDIVTAILERSAIAMENARLLAESQKRAVKERTIGEISAKISAQSDIDQLLKTAVQELNRTLHGTEIAIQFTSHEETE
jgi:GAF domain-containing protein/HAMP domain-containing protein